MYRNTGAGGSAGGSARAIGTTGGGTRAVGAAGGTEEVDRAEFDGVGVKISPRVSQKRLRFGDDVGKREFIKFTKKYHQQLEEEECASVGRIVVRAMSPPRLADIGILLQQAEDASRD